MKRRRAPTRPGRRLAAWVLATLPVVLFAAAATRASAGDAESAQGTVAEAVPAEDLAALEELVETRPDDLSVHIRFQDAARQAGREREILRRYQLHAGRRNATASDHYLFARVQDSSSGLASLRRALALDPAHVPTLLALGQACLERGDPDAARSAFRNARAAAAGSPATGLAVVGLASVERRSGDDVAAEALLREAVSTSPALAIARVELGVLLTDLGRYDAAQAILDGAMAVHPADAAVRAARAYLVRRRPEPDAPEEAEEDAGPDAPSAAEEDAPEPDPVVAELLEAARAAPGSAVLRLALSAAALRANEPALADDEAQAALLLDPGSVGVRVLMGVMALRQGLANDAEASADAALAAERDAPAALLLRGLARWADGRARRGGRDLERAARAAPDNALALRALGAFHAARAQWRDAEQLYEEAVRLDPDHADPLRELAYVQRASGDGHRSALTLEALVQLFPKDFDGWLLLARVRHVDLRDKHREAAAAYRRYLELGGADTRVAAWLAEVSAP